MRFLACDPLLLLFWEPFRKRSADRRSLAEFCSAPATKTIRSQRETWRRPEGEELCRGACDRKGNPRLEPTFTAFRRATSSRRHIGRISAPESEEFQKFHANQMFLKTISLLQLPPCRLSLLLHVALCSISRSSVFLFCFFCACFCSCTAATVAQSPRVAALMGIDAAEGLVHTRAHKHA